MNKCEYAQVISIGHFLFILSYSLQSLYIKFKVEFIRAGFKLGKSCMVLYEYNRLYAYNIFRLI
jgi:hypothetical protein